VLAVASFYQEHFECNMNKLRNQVLPKRGEISWAAQGEKAALEINAPPTSQDKEIAIYQAPLAATSKGRWERTWPVFAAGAGLFSDGYVNGVIGSVNTMLRLIYTTEYTDSRAQSNVSAIAFAGAVVGSFVFGYTSDHWSRKNSLLIATGIIVLFSALGAASYGAGGSTQGLFAALAAYRFFLGIGIGGEYPAGSVACAEATGELKYGHRNRWFIFSTDFAIDAGFVVAALVPMIVVLATTEKHLRVAWRICLGLGVVCPLSLLYLRLKLKEPEAFLRNKLNTYPYWIIVKLYWYRLFIVSLIWFMYDFSAYSFGIYSSSWLQFLIGDNPPLWQTFGWNT
jgi:MFS family permease